MSNEIYFNISTNPLPKTEKIRWYFSSPDFSELFNINVVRIFIMNDVIRRILIRYNYRLDICLGINDYKFADCKKILFKNLNKFNIMYPNKIIRFGEYITDMTHSIQQIIDLKNTHVDNGKIYLNSNLIWKFKNGENGWPSDSFGHIMVSDKYFEDSTPTITTGKHLRKFVEFNINVGKVSCNIKELENYKPNIIRYLFLTQKYDEYFEITGELLKKALEEYNDFVYFLLELELKIKEENKENKDNDSYEFIFNIFDLEDNIDREICNEFKTYTALKIVSENIKIIRANINKISKENLMNINYFIKKFFKMLGIN